MRELAEIQENNQNKSHCPEIETTRLPQRKYLKFSVELIFILIIVTGGFTVLENKKNSPYLEGDEAAWILTGYYFDLYFLRFDLFHPDWSDYEAFDHPPLAKYIVGGTTHLRGYTVDSLAPKKLWNDLSVDKLHMIFDLAKYKIPDPTTVIPFTRSVIFLFALFSLILIYISVRILYGVLTAFLSTCMIISSPIYNYYSVRILADPILLFFFSLFFLLCALYSKSQKHIYIVLAFIVSSLAFLTKLNGILLVPLLLLFFLINNKFSVSKENLKFVMIGIIAFVIICIVLNPVFLNTGIKAFWKMVDARWSVLRAWQGKYQNGALFSMGDRLLATEMIFLKHSIFYQLIKVPVELILFGAGTYYIFWKRDLLLILIFAFLIVVPISMLPDYMPRYAYWINPFICVIAGLSLNLFKEALSQKKLRLIKETINPSSKRHTVGD